MIKAVLALWMTTALGAAAALAQPADTDPPADETDDGDDDGDADSPDTDADDDKPDDGDSSATAPTAEPVGDVDALRRRYLELRDKLFRSRARARTVASALYSTALEVKLSYKSARHYTVTRATIRVDGTNVFDDANGKIGDDDAVRFQGFVAPGRHRIGVRIEATGKDDDRFTTITESVFVVIAVEGEDLEVVARAEDSGDIAYNWQRKEKGSYKLSLGVSVKSTPRKGAKNKKKKTAKATKAPAASNKRHRASR